MSLIDVCYEQIKDKYLYCIFDDLKLIVKRNSGFSTRQIYVMMVRNDLKIGFETRKLKSCYDMSHRFRSEPIKCLIC